MKKMIITGTILIALIVSVAAVFAEKQSRIKNENFIVFVFIIKKYNRRPGWREQLFLPVVVS